MQPPRIQESRTRHHPRYEVDAYADVAGQEVLLYHRIRNVSLGGLCIESLPVGEVGSEVAVTLSFPELGAEVALSGEIAWANHAPHPDLGIRWTSLGDDERDLLSRYLERAARRETSPADRAPIARA